MEVVRNQHYSTLQLTDNQIIRRVISGEKEIFEILIRRYNQTLYRVVRGYVHDEDDVMDIMQDTYLKAYNKIDQYRLDALFSTWLIRIGINEALQSLRRNKKMVRMKAEVSSDHQIESNKHISTSTPETSTINNEMKVLLEKAISQINEKYRIVFILCEVERLSQQEVADCLQISVSNVKVRLHRAKNLIKNQLLTLSHDTSIFEFGNAKCDLVVGNVMKRIL